MTEGLFLADEDALGFLTLNEPVAETPVVETPAPPEPPVEQTPAPEAVQPPATETPAQQPGFIPLSAMLDEREKRQAAERQRADLERQLQELRKPQNSPTVTSDPQGWAAQQEAKFQETELKLKLGMSERWASKQYGDILPAAREWGMQQHNQDPYFIAKFTGAADPFQWLVEQYQRDQTLGKLGGKSFEDAAQEWAASQGYVKPDGAQTQQQPGGAQVPAQPAAPLRPAAPPRSIAGAPPAGAVNSQPVIREEDLASGLFER